MIDEVLISLKEYLSYMMLKLMQRRINVSLNSVNKDKEAESKDHLVITLLRIEEETSRKPQNIYAKRDDGIHTKSPDLDINLEILISSPFTPYETALQLISKAISAINSIKTVQKPEGMNEELFQRIRSYNMSLLGLSFDQTLSMWQTLGATLVPSVAYKVRMLTVEGAVDTSDIRIVEHVSVEPAVVDPRTKQVKATTLPPASEKKFEESQAEPEPASGTKPKKASGTRRSAPKADKADKTDKTDKK